MRQLVFVVLFSILHLNAEAASKGRGLELKMVLCSELLKGHMTDPHPFHPFDQLESRLDQVRVATLLIKVPTTLSASQVQIDAALTHADLLNPQHLRGVHLGQLYTVVFGQKYALLEFAAQLEKRLKLPGGVTFQILDWELHDMQIERPPRTINLNAFAKIEEAHAEMQKLLSEQQPFVAINEDLKPFAFYPKSMLKPLLELSQATLDRAQLNILKTSTPSSWTDWLNANSGDLHSGVIADFDEWVVLTQEAYSFARQLTKSIRRQNISPISDNLREGIDFCLNEECRLFAEPHSDLGQPQYHLDDESISAILDHVAKTSEQRVSGQGQLRNAFLSLVPLDPNNALTVKYQNTLAEIAIPHSLYVQLKMKPVGQKTMRRLAEAWKAYLAAEQIPEAEKEVNLTNINRALARLASRQQTRPISSPPVFSVPSPQTRVTASPDVTSTAPAPAGKRESVIGTEHIEEWAERYADALTERLKESAPEHTQSAVILDIDPSRTLGPPAFQEAILSRMSSDTSYFDFHTAYTLADLNLELALHAPPTLKNAAEQVLDSNSDEIRAFEHLFNLLFSSTPSLIVNHFENLLSFPRDQQNAVVNELGKKALTIIYDRPAAKSTIEVVLRQTAWNVIWQSFQFEENSDTLRLPQSADSPEGFALIYADQAMKALKELFETDSARFRRSLIALQMLANDPMYPSLNSIGINHEMGYGTNAFRSRINQGPNAWRIIWRYEGGSERKIRILNVVGHSAFQ